MEFIAKMSLTRQELFTFSNNEEKNWCMDNTGSEVQATPGRQSVHSLVLGPNLASVDPSECDGESEQLGRQAGHSGAGSGVVSHVLACSVKVLSLSVH